MTTSIKRIVSLNIPISENYCPAGFLVRDNENIITTEIFYDYEPTFTGTVMAPVEVYNYAIFRPRFVNLTSIDP